MSRPVRWLSNLLLVCASLGLAFGTAELALRTVPALLPPGVYGSSAFSDEIGLGVHAGPLLYNKVRSVRRAPNDIGFLDVDHETGRRPGVTRIGFFGDSYVEAAQVELSQTFFRLLPDAAQKRSVETLAFGISGWGALHAYLAERALGPRYGLDAVVYVFVENDPGDSLWSIMKDSGASTLRPYGTLVEDPPGFSLSWILDPHAASAPRRAAKWVQQHSVLAQLVLGRVAMLRSHGVRTRADPHAAAMTEEAAAAVPDSNDMPHTWPASYREDAAELMRRVLLQWRNELRARGVPLYVLYVPRGAAQLTGELPLASTWRPWLGRTLEGLDIPLIDPTEALAEKERAGVAMYDDHFSPEGHATVAGVLADALASVPVAPDTGAVASGPPQ